MSLTENMSSFVVKPLSEFKGVEIEQGQYLARKIEKGTGKESKGVIIPEVNAEDFTLALTNETVFTAAIAWWQSQVENAVKARIDTGANMIVPADYSVEVISTMIQEEETKQGRVSKESISAWFKSVVSPILYRAFSEKLGESLTNEKANELIANYGKCFVRFAKREDYFNGAVKDNMRKALDLLPESAMKQYCEKKYAEFTTEKSADDWGL